MKEPFKKQVLEGSYYFEEAMEGTDVVRARFGEGMHEYFELSMDDLGRLKIRAPGGVLSVAMSASNTATVTVRPGGEGIKSTIDHRDRVDLDQLPT